MSMIKLLTHTTLVTLSTPYSCFGGVYSISASAKLSNFDAGITQGFTGSDSMPRGVRVERHNIQPDIWAEAAASPFGLFAKFDATRSGINTPSASSSFSDIFLIFEDTPGLRSLAVDSSGVDLVFHFSVEVVIDTENFPSGLIQPQASSSVSVGFSIPGHDSIQGTHRVQQTNGNQPFIDSSTGVLDGLGIGGGTVEVSVPFNVAPDSPSSLIVALTGSAGSNGLAFSESHAFGQISVRPSDIPVTLSDGTSVEDMGVNFSLTPDHIPLLGPCGGLGVGGDFDEDCDVDGSDLTQWQGDFGLNGNSDADFDTDSDGADFLRWQRNFGTGVFMSEEIIAIPEPSACVMAIFYLTCVVIFRGIRT